ncbi:MAG TPA: hypothetical protein VGF69_03300 [Thermoanaerobaculia bacterium]|jgi:hypothetical protein
MKKFIEWDSIEVRVDGAKIAEQAKAMILGKPPIEKLDIAFENGLILVTGAIRKFILVPFTVEVRHIYARGTTVYVPLAKINAGKFPIPTILLDLLKEQIPKDVVQYQEPATFVLPLDRFLPSFVTADIQKVWIIDGGLAVTLGRGGADMPV